MHYKLSIAAVVSIATPKIHHWTSISSILRRYIYLVKTSWKHDNGDFMWTALTLPTSKEKNCCNFEKKINGILLPKLFWPTVSCSSDQEKLLKFEAESREFSKNLRLLEQFIRTVRDQEQFWKQNDFLTYSWRFLRL